MKENYDNNKEFKITRIFSSKIYMCFFLSPVPKCFSFLLCLFLYRKNMVSTNTKILKPGSKKFSITVSQNASICVLPLLSNY